MSEHDTIADPDGEPGRALTLQATGESAGEPVPMAEARSAEPLAALQDQFPGEVEMSLVDHLEELRRRVLRSLLAVVIGAAACLAFVRPLVKLLEMPASGVRTS